MLGIILESRDPAFNLALEEWLFTSLPARHDGYFLLWQNDPSIIIGRHQCALEEIDIGAVKSIGIPVIRRVTGGGAVYHDGGNLNFSFIRNVSGAEKPDFATYLKPVCRALSALGISAQISGRNDLEVGGKKISGSGQWLRKGRVLHHGTLLYNANLEILARVLKPSKLKIQSKGIASVRSRVANIADLLPGLTLPMLKNALIEAAADDRGDLAAEDINQARKLAASKYENPAWNFGASPPFDFEKRAKFAFGEVVVRLSVRGGQIRHCRIEGDFFGDTDALVAMLTGVKFEKEALRGVLKNADWESFFYGCQPEAMLKFFSEWY